MSNRQTVFFLPVDPMDKNHKDPETIDLNAPRHAQHMHKAWKKHQNTVHWVDIKLVQKKGFKFYQTRPNAVILHETLPAYCIPKVVRMETGEVKNEKVYASPRLPPKISLKHDWMKELGPEVTQRPEGQVVQQNSKVPNQSNQIQTQIMTERGNPLLEPTQGSRQVEEKRPVLRRSKHVLFMKKLSNMIEWCNPLLKQEHPKHVPLMKAQASTLETKQFMKERSNPS